MSTPPPELGYEHVKTSEISWQKDATLQEIWDDPSKRFTVKFFVTPELVLDGVSTYLFAGDEDMIVSVTVPRHLPESMPDGRPPLAMRLQITSLVRLPNGGDVLPQANGDPPIICDLNPKQAKSVWQQGVPESLVRQMVQTAKDVSWKPISPLGQKKTTRSPVIIDPEVHFIAAPVGLPDSSSSFKIWQFEDRAVWLVLGAQGQAFQCRADRSVYRSEGRVEGDHIFWESIWGTDRIQILDDAVVLENEYGSFRFHKVDVIARRCECPFPVPMMAGPVTLRDEQ